MSATTDFLMEKMDLKARKVAKEEEAINKEIEFYTQKLQSLMGSGKKEENFLFLTKEDIEEAIKAMVNPKDLVMVIRANKESIVEYPEDETTPEHVVNVRAEGKDLKVSIVSPNSTN